MPARGLVGPFKRARDLSSDLDVSLLPNSTPRTSPSPGQVAVIIVGPFHNRHLPRTGNRFSRCLVVKCFVVDLGSLEVFTVFGLTRRSPCRGLRGSDLDPRSRVPKTRARILPATHSVLLLAERAYGTADDVPGAS